MKRRMTGTCGLLAVLAAALMPATADARIDGITGTTFNLSAKKGYISTPDGGSIFMWGFADDDGTGGMQYPGPTLIVNQGDTITINLANELDAPTSIVFPGHAVVATGDRDGILTAEADAGTPGALPGTVVPGHARYIFTATMPGTFTYYSGTRPEFQVEMGLVGAIVVRPVVGGTVRTNQAFADPSTTFDREYLFLLTELDPVFHGLARWGLSSLVDASHWWPVWWMINGRAAPDTMHAAFAPWLPNQPYNAMPMQHPGEKLLLRFVGGNREPHPFHVHGQHARVLARDGRPYASVEGGAIDLSQAQFSITVAPGETTDAIFSWAGTGLGWDIYGHAPGDPMLPGELASDHGKPIPVVVPSDLDLTIGEFWSGSPYLGKTGGLAPGLGVQSEEGSYTFMWHSHSEKEMTNNNVFPGGMMTMLMIMSPDVMIME